MTPAGAKPSKMALIVHSDLTALSGMQSGLAAQGYVCVVARDLPTALMAITQHYFDLAIVSSRLGEGGDGWPLAGVVHLVFPRAFVAVLTPGEPDVLTFQAAINNGITQVYQQSNTPSELVKAIIADVSRPQRNTSTTLQ